MQIHELPKTTVRKNKRVGRGYGSGKGGHTSGRGMKGQGARGTVAAWFEGGQLPMVRRFPFIRGKSRFNPIALTAVTLNVGSLNNLKPNTEVNLKTLITSRLVSPSRLKLRSVKILGGGTLTVPLIVKVPVSKKAAEKIESAGGRIDSGSSA